MANFAVRLSDQGKKFPQINVLGKFAGAVGNYNAHKAAYPTIDWPSIAADFVRSLGIEFNPYVTQVIFIVLLCCHVHMFSLAVFCYYIIGVLEYLVDLLVMFNITMLLSYPFSFFLCRLSLMTILPSFSTGLSRLTTLYLILTEIFGTIYRWVISSR